MPIYEYTCTDCESQFEKFVRSMNSQPKITCPHCGGTHVKKGWSVFGTAASDGGVGDFSAAAAAAACSPGGT